MIFCSINLAIHNLISYIKVTMNFYALSDEELNE